jgi:hypothetical protein
MYDFRTIAGATDMFGAVNGLGNSNIIFMALKDTNRQGMKYGIAGGMAAGLGVGIIVHSNAAKEVLANNFDALLINRTEQGMGIIPLHSKKIVLNSVKVENLEPNMQNYVFLGNDIIKEIKIKDHSIFNKKVQSLKIKLDEKNTIHLMVRKVEKDLPYHENNFSRIMDQY